jgi:hypothetical protein
MPDAPRPPRRRINLFQLLPPAARAVLALLVIAAVSALAWWTGRNDPVPAWIETRLVPLLGWAWLALAGVAIASWWLQWLRRRKARDEAARRPPP